MWSTISGGSGMEVADEDVDDLIGNGWWPNTLYLHPIKRLGHTEL